MFRLYLSVFLLDAGEKESEAKQGAPKLTQGTLFEWASIALYHTLLIIYEFK